MDVSSLFSPLYWTGGGVCLSSFYKYHRQKRRKGVGIKERGRENGSILRSRRG